MSASSPPKLVASVGSVMKGRREAIEVALRRANDRTAVDVRVFAVHGADRTPTARGLWVPLADLRAIRRLLADADRKAVALGLLPIEGGVL